MNDTFSVRCFRNRKRKKTHTLTKYEARCFLKTVKHLAKYLKKEYQL